MDFPVLMQSVPVGPYISAYKVVPVLLVCIAWWRWLTWVDKDALVARLPREWLNAGMLGGFALAVALLLGLPSFWLAFPLFILLFLAEVGAYLAVRNSKVGLKDLIADIKSFKIGLAKKKAVAADVPGMVTLSTKDGRAMSAPEAGTPERQIYDVVQMMIAEPLRRGMERLDLVPVEGAMVAQYWVDGVVYNGAQFNRNGAAGAVVLLKRLAGLDLNEKRKPQTGMIQTTVEGKRKEVQVQTAGSTSGETLRLSVDPKHRHDLKLDHLGFSADQIQRIQVVVGEPGGVVLVAVPKGQGLTSTLYAIIRQHDAFLTQIQSVERAPEEDLEGVTQNALSRGASPQDELDKVQWVISQEPNTIVMPEIHNAKSARAMVACAGERRIYVGLRSGSAVDAINDWRTMVGDDEHAMRHLRMVISGRVLRKLCPACKQPYQPDPDTMRKLNLDHGRVSQFYQARTHPMQDQKGNPIPCAFCADMRYQGRTGIFEVMDINDEVRQAVLQNASPKQLLSLFRKMRGRFTQESAMDLVEKGETSIQEVLRAMRGQERDPAVAKAAAAAAAAAGTAAGIDAGKTHAVGNAPAVGPNRPKSPPNK